VNPLSCTFRTLVIPHPKCVISGSVRSITPDGSADLARLRRWEDAGGTWELLAAHADAVTVSLRRCDAGEEVDRLTSTSPDLLDYVRATAD